MTSVSKAMSLVKSKVVKSKETAKKVAKNPMAELTKKGKSFRNRSKSPKKEAHKVADKVEKVTEKPIKKVANITEKKPESKAAETVSNAEAPLPPPPYPAKKAVETVANAENPLPPPTTAKVSPKISVQKSNCELRSQRWQTLNQR